MIVASSSCSFDRYVPRSTTVATRSRFRKPYRYCERRTVATTCPTTSVLLAVLCDTIMIELIDLQAASVHRSIQGGHGITVLLRDAIIPLHKVLLMTVFLTAFFQLFFLAYYI